MSAPPGILHSGGVQFAYCFGPCFGCGRFCDGDACVAPLYELGLDGGYAAFCPDCCPTCLSWRKESV